MKRILLISVLMLLPCMLLGETNDEGIILGPFIFKPKFSHFFTFESNIIQSSGLNIKLTDRYVRGFLEVSEIEPQREVVWGTNRFYKNYFVEEALYNIIEKKKIM